LAEANFTNATLTGAKLDGTILAYQKIAEQLQQENQTLTEQVKLLEEQLEKHKTDTRFKYSQ
jgi:cell division protein FtsB